MISLRCRCGFQVACKQNRCKPLSLLVEPSGIEPLTSTLPVLNMVKKYALYSVYTVLLPLALLIYHSVSPLKSTISLRFVAVLNLIPSTRFVALWTIKHLCGLSRKSLLKSSAIQTRFYAVLSLPLLKNNRGINE